MAWEQRGNRTYYYRKYRAGGRVVSEYIGTGADAALIARLDEVQGEAKRTEREVNRIRRQDDAEQDRELNDIEALLQLLTEAALVAEGYHQHKGQWRRRRDGNRDNEQPGGQADRPGGQD